MLLLCRDQSWKLVSAGANRQKSWLWQKCPRSEADSTLCAINIDYTENTKFTCIQIQQNSCLHLRQLSHKRNKIFSIINIYSPIIRAWRKGPVAFSASNQYIVNRNPINTKPKTLIRQYASHVITRAHHLLCNSYTCTDDAWKAHKEEKSNQSSLLTSCDYSPRLSRSVSCSADISGAH